jgi:3-hydroxyanthranilate 3,4-dioxygenase
MACPVAPIPNGPRERVRHCIPRGHTPPPGTSSTTFTIEVKVVALKFAFTQEEPMPLTPPLNFIKWLDENRSLLKPPVGNQVLWKDSDFIVMVVGGPNARKDYHFNEGEEFFYQLEGDIVLKVIDEGAPRDIPIRAGEMFLLPPRVPHSPQRPANSIGLVVERRRSDDAQDGFQWYCESCGTKLYEEYLHLTDIVSQLPPIFQRFYGSPSLRSCGRCDTVMSPP